MKQSVQELTIPTGQFFMIDGVGDPNGIAFQQAVEALYALSYTLRFWTKKHQAPPDWSDFKVQPLEGLWSVPEIHDSSAMNAPRDSWHWTAMIKQPDFLTIELFDQLKSEVALKKPDVQIEQVRLEIFEEGPVVEILHVGPYTSELPNIQKLDDYISGHSLKAVGRHHEIYLSDPRRTDPAKLRTLLRHPVEKV